MSWVDFLLGRKLSRDHFDSDCVDDCTLVFARVSVVYNVCVVYIGVFLAVVMLCVPHSKL